MSRFRSARAPVRTSLFLALAAGCGDAPQPAPEASLAGRDTMQRRFAEILRRTPEENRYVGDAKARALRQRLAGLPADRPVPGMWETLSELGEEELRLGNEEEAVALLTRALERALDDPVPVAPDVLDRLRYRLGVAHLRSAETRNCCRRHTPESCILPIRGGGIHRDREPSAAAIAQLLRVLQSAAPDSDLFLASLWLLNIAHMTLGGYPDDVPEPYRIPPATFAPDREVQRFENVAPDVGLATESLAGGVIADDLDGDGDLDVLVSSWDPRETLRYFANDADGSFTDRTVEAGLERVMGGLNLVQADYDNDGDLDVLVLRGAWLVQAGRHPNSLLRNDGGRFTDVTLEAGLADPARPTQTAAWADYDNDGDLDLYVGNETYGGVRAPSQLFRNEGDGTFTDVAETAGVTNDRFAKAVAWGDYDGDRFPDLYVSNKGGENRLYRNNGDHTFTDVARKLGVTEPIESFPTWFFDYDNDGDLDLFVAAYDATIADLAAAALGRPTRGSRARLYQNNGEGGFKDVGREAGLVDLVAPMGSNFGDLDNDGFLDFYLGTGYPDYQDVMPNVMYLNDGGGHFLDVTTAAGLGHLQKGHGIAFADFDHDGDCDLFAEMGGAYPGDKYTDALFENPGFGNRWICVELVGTSSNRAAIGARIRVEIVEDGETRSIYRHVNSGGSFGANPLRQTIGLGRAAQIRVLEVHWPTTDTTQVFEGVRLDGFLRITEGDDRPESLERKRFELGAA